MKTHRYIFLVAILTASASGHAQDSKDKSHAMHQAPRFDLPAPQLQPRACLRPFHHAGTVQFPSNYSGVTGEFTFPKPYYLRIDHVTARLHQLGLRGGEIGGETAGRFGWHIMRVEGETAVYAAKRDKTIYLDPGALGKVAVYRMNTGTESSGEFSVDGCLMDRIPIGMNPRIPELILPRKLPTMVPPVEKIKHPTPRTRPMTQPAGN